MSTRPRRAAPERRTAALLVPWALVALLIAALLVVQTSEAALQGSTANAGNSAAADTLTGPSTLSASAGTLTCRIRLTWSTTGTSSWASGYKIYRSTSSAGPFTTVLATVTPQTASSYDDVTGLLSTQTFYYQIRSFHATTWVSPASATASATAPTVCV
jgi:hypothetical protein